MASVGQWGAPASYGSAPKLENGSVNSSESNAKREAMERKLWYWNLACAIAHLVQAAVALGLG